MENIARQERYCPCCNATDIEDVFHAKHKMEEANSHESDSEEDTYDEDNEITTDFSDYDDSHDDSDSSEYVDWGLAIHGKLLICYDSSHKEKVKAIQDILPSPYKDAAWKEFSEESNPSDNENYNDDEVNKLMENVEVFLMCFSETTETNPVSKDCARYALYMEKYMIHLRMESEYDPRGWLAFIDGETFYDLDDIINDKNNAKENFLEEITHLIGERKLESRQIQFPGPRGNTAQYIIVEGSKDNKKVIELLTNWRLEKPTLMISVKSSTKPFKMTKRLSHTLRSGLTASALNTSVWIFTDGADMGVTREVGKAVKNLTILSSAKLTIAVIGIARLECVFDRKTLESSEKKPVCYPRKEISSTDEFCLEPNHTHFIFVKNAGRKGFNKFRTQLEFDMAKSQMLVVPLVQLVVEGGRDTLRAVRRAVKKQTPTVIVKNSGGVADILAYAYEHSDIPETEVLHEKKLGKLDSSAEENVKQKIQQMFPQSDVERYTKRIREIVQQIQLISVYDFGNDSRTQDLEGAILRAFMKGKNVMEKQQQKYNEDFLMLFAIRENRVDILEQLLDTGVRIEKSKVVEHLMLKMPEAKQFFGEDFTESDMSQVAKDMSQVAKRMEKIENFIKKITDDKFSLKVKKQPGKGKEFMTRSDIKPQTFIFIWSLLMNRQSMAKLFWMEGEDAIATALVGYSMLRQLKTLTENKELASNISNNMKEWSALAMGVLSECFSNNEQNSQELLQRKLPNWGNTDCLSLAMKAHNKEFISHPACQKLLDDLWKGDINPKLSMFMIVLGAICPILITRMKQPTGLKAIGTAGPIKGAGSENADCKTDKNETKSTIPQQSGVHGTESHTEQKPTDVTSSGTTGSNHDARGTNADQEKDANETKRSSANEKKQKGPAGIFFKAPVTKFVYNTVSYLIFLGLYTYVILFNFGPQVSTAEIILILWVSALFIEEIKQFVEKPDYFTDLWNIVDNTTMLLFITGIILRFLPYDNTLVAGRVILSLNIIVLCLRLLHIFSIHKTLGPKLVMIRKMVRDLMHFLLIMSLFLVSYAIASHAILYPNSSLTWTTAGKVLRKPYWNMFGELFLHEIEGEETCSNDQTLWINDTYPRCPSEVGKVVVPLLMGVYVLLTNVLLINLLIAMFSYTFIKVQKNTDKHWCFQRYSFIHEYMARSEIPAPFSALVHVLKFIQWFYSKKITLILPNCFKNRVSQQPELQPQNTQRSGMRRKSQAENKFYGENKSHGEMRKKSQAENKFYGENKQHGENKSREKNETIGETVSKRDNEPPIKTISQGEKNVHFENKPQVKHELQEENESQAENESQGDIESPAENNSQEKHKQHEYKRNEKATNIKREHERNTKTSRLIAWEKLMADRYIQKQKQQELKKK